MSSQKHDFQNEYCLHDIFGDGQRSAGTCSFVGAGVASSEVVPDFVGESVVSDVESFNMKVNKTKLTKVNIVIFFVFRP